MGDFDYKRRKTSEVKVGRTAIGGNNPIRIQSMTNTSTMDTDGSVAQSMRMADKGAELIRLTAQGVREAENIGRIKEKLRSEGIDVPLVADIHFNPRAAYAAVGNAEKVRINPGNFADPGRTFKKIDYTDEEYQRELAKLEESLIPFLDLCKENKTAIRIGVNHGSLSDRIMSRYGDTPAGMAESAMEFLRVCVKRGFDDVVISIKASNVVVMVTTVRLLVEAMDKEGMSFPLHIGVTEAGDGEDGRIKSAVGIGTLLSEGIGDTIRVSLSEDPVDELPIARKLVDYINTLNDAPSIKGEKKTYLPGQRRETISYGNTGGKNVPVVIGVKADEAYDKDNLPDIYAEDISDLLHLEAPLLDEDVAGIKDNRPIVLSSSHANFRGAIESALSKLIIAGKKNPVIIHAVYKGIPKDEVIIRASVDIGSVLLDGYGDGIFIESDCLTADEAARLSFGILQATRLRISHTEYIACPGCGRTLFDLQNTLGEIKKSTKHLKGLKIGVMGCIVNGPGEMADADYGYVGAGTGKVSLYRGKECVEKNIPSSQAVDKLLKLIEADKR